MTRVTALLYLWQLARVTLVGALLTQAAFVGQMHKLAEVILLTKIR